MSALFLLPGLISLFLVLRGKLETAFLSVYLPTLLLLPDGYDFRLPHLPPISAAQSALIPIGAVALFRLVLSGLPSLMDVLIVLFMVSITASEVTQERVMNDGILSAIVTVISILFAYAVGRKIIEPGLRFVTVRRLVILILLLGPFGLYEWRMGQNLFGVFGQRLFDAASVHADVQFRSGHGRMAVSFNDSELAGIVFGMTAALNVWLSYMDKWRLAPNLGKRLSKLEKYHIPGLLLLLYVYLTQSRGPQIATGVGYLILQIPKFKNKKTAIILASVVIVVGAAAAYQYFNRYTTVSDPSAMNEQQGSAIYRRQMNELYGPIAAQGGLLGWGLLSHPILVGMFSIDNEFLLIHLAYGSAGYFLFILIAAETFRRPLKYAWTWQRREDQAMAVSMLAALAIFWISIATVYMGEQMPQIAFLLIGWSQSLMPGATANSAVADDVPSARFAFSRVFR